ncbi:MAG: helix-turn-helix transcriptional regulator [Solirubrobacterales bacterium]|nr:helix-turn-helix transcriptional regulator [Solirubrobacterales bacterium]
MAAAGGTNREIAQELFASRKTVETHLRHCYQKLDLAGRGELANALSRAEPR